MAPRSRFAGLAGLAAALSMTAAPLSAAELPDNLVRPAASGSVFMNGFDTSTYDSRADSADWRRCWGRWGCRGRGWRGRGWRGRRGIDAGDVLAGVLVIGGIAAIASAANNNRRQRERDVVVVERDRVRYDDRYDDRRYDRRRDDRRYDDRQYEDRRYESGRRDDRRSDRRVGDSGLQNAVDMCLREIERDVRVDDVDSVTRTARGWSVTGRVFDGSDFLCAIGNDGRIESLDYSNFSGSAQRGAPEPSPATGAGVEPVGDTRQWSDARYRTARAAMAGSGPAPVGTANEGARIVRVADRGRPDAPLVPLTAERQPAYPGGPIAGEDIPEQLPIDGDLRD